MQITQENREEIKTRFKEVTNIKQLVSLMNQVYGILYPKSKKKFEVQVRTLQFLAFKKQDRYKSFTIKKRNGGERPISAPIYTLKVYQRLINVILNCVFEPHKAATGFILGKSIVDNSKRHVGKKFVYNIDLEGFFPNTPFRRIKTVLGLEPIGWSGEKEELAFLVANLCCENGCLPQGAPTSPTLTNIVCQRLDRKLIRFAFRRKASYSRYADDITFSSNLDVFNEDFKAELKKIIEEEKFVINESKVRLLKRNSRQEVTGIIVNKKPNLNEKYIRRVRFWLYLWKKHGYDNATIRFRSDYEQEKGFIRYDGRVPELHCVLRGKINFLSMVRGKDDSIYLRYKKLFDELLGESIPVKQRTSSLSDSDLLKILMIWKNQGIEKAISTFYNSN